jgi:hypothetical protein|tara:strand:- start:1180 stop:1680 length:501 start_codon:yes stop_codon:yes gene_type:complete
MIKRLLNFIFGEDNSCNKKDYYFKGNTVNSNNIVDDSNIPDNVSEPVISFVKCFKENPKRFKGYFGMNTEQVYSLEDKVTGIKYTYSLESYTELRPSITRIYSIVGSLNINYEELELTFEESRFLVKSLRGIMQNRVAKRNKILEQRKQRTQKRLREKLTKFYQEG